MSGRSAQAMASAPAPISKMDQLKQLAELRDSGVLTQEEFDSEKAKVLAQS
jgi:hypothetical protein